MQEPYSISLDAFEGPLELLLFLIKKAEVDIYDIPIAHITREYLEHVTVMQDMQLEVAGEFFVMAATLMLIKSQMLLPRPSTNEMEDVDDPRTELMQQLMEYERIRKLAKEMQALEEDAQLRFPRGIDEPPDEQQKLMSMSLFDLLDAMQRVLLRDEPIPVEILVREEMRIEDCVIRIRKMIVAHPEGVYLTDLVEEGYRKIDLVVTFISVLELWRLGEISVRQSKTFGPITVMAA